MKKTLSLVLCSALIATASFAQGVPENTFTRESAAEVPTVEEEDENGSSFVIAPALVSTFLWRGLPLAGVSMQADLCFNYALGNWNFGVGSWFNHSFQETILDKFEKIAVAETDVYAYVSYGDLTLVGMGYFAPDNPAHVEAYETDALELGLSYYLGDDLPFTVQWTTILGNYDTDEDTGKKLYGSYAEVAYDFELGPVGMTATLGGIPWKSAFYELDKGGITNISLTASYHNKEHKVMRWLPLQTTVGYNPAFQCFLFSIGIQLE